MTAPRSVDAAPCPACPWRISNRGKRHPDGWYTKANLRRLWTGLRTGEADGMTCHPTDPNNEVSPAAQAAGYRPAPEGSQVLECRGALILQQREVHLWQDEFGGDLREYRRARPFGLTRDGLRAVVVRLAFGGTPLSGPRPARPNLNTPDVGHAPLGEWKPVGEAEGGEPGEPG